MVHKNIWSTPTKTFGASCHKGKCMSNNYQPGGVLSVVANSLTSKIQSVATDSLGRWTKTRFFAKKGAFIIYSIYRPNPGSLKSSSVNSAWMQQYRALNTKDTTNIDPRQRLIEDVIEDVTKEKVMGGKMLLADDFNEDTTDGHTDGINKLMESFSLCNVFQEVKGHSPSTRNNRRAIDHFLISTEILPLVTQAGMLPDESSFTSDHSGNFIDLSPKVLDRKNQPITPPKQRKLKMYNRPKVHKYIEYVLNQFESHNIVSCLQQLMSERKTTGFHEEAGITLNKIDAQVTEIMLRSEDRLSPDDTPYAYSADLDQQMRTVRVTKKLQDAESKNFPLETYVNQDLEDVAVDILRMTPEKVEETLQEQREILKDMQTRSWEIRDGHNKKIREKAAQKQRKDVEIAVKEMKHRELQSRMFARIGYTLKSMNYTQITRLGLPQHICTENTSTIWEYIQSTDDSELKRIEWSYIEDTHEIERRLLE